MNRSSRPMLPHFISLSQSVVPGTFFSFSNKSVFRKIGDDLFPCSLRGDLILASRLPLPELYVHLAFSSVNREVLRRAVPALTCSPSSQYLSCRPSRGLFANKFSQRGHHPFGTPPTVCFANSLSSCVSLLAIQTDPVPPEEQRHPPAFTQHSRLRLPRSRYSSA